MDVGVPLVEEEQVRNPQLVDDLRMHGDPRHVAEVVEPESRIDPQTPEEDHCRVLLRSKSPGGGQESP